MRTDKRPDSLRIAIVGCGRMGLQHARSASQLGHRIRVACDVDVARASALASEHPGCEVVTDAANVRWDEVDAAFVCTPPFARGPVELFAAQAGVVAGDKLISVNGVPIKDIVGYQFHQTNARVRVAVEVL